MRSESWTWFVRGLRFAPAVTFVIGAAVAGIMGALLQVKAHCNPAIPARGVALRLPQDMVSEAGSLGGLEHPPKGGSSGFRDRLFL